MFTVSGRVINELVELTCAINFSLLFRFEARAPKKNTEEAKQPKLSRRMEGKRKKEMRKERKMEHFNINNNNTASNLPPNHYHDSNALLLMF